MAGIGGMGPKNASHSAALAAVLTEELGIPKSRFYCHFQDVEGGLCCSRARPLSRANAHKGDEKVKKNTIICNM